MATMTVNFSHRGLNLQADLYTWPASKGARDSFNGRAGCGIQLEPDEEAGFDVEAVRMVSLDDEDLTAEDIAEIMADDDGIYQSIVDELEGMEPDYI